MTCELAFVREHAFGRLLGVKISEDGPSEADLERLMPAEIEPLARYRRARRGTWVGGRIALIEACERLGCDRVPIVNDARGAPVLPDGVSGSLTHKDDFAIALVDYQPDSTSQLGVDLERIDEKQEGVAKMILTPEELTQYHGLAKHERDMFLIVRFSLKEAIYKALDRFVGRYVGFKEVQIEVDDEGRFSASCTLKHAEGPFQIELECEALSLPELCAKPMVLSAARICRVN